MKKLPRLLLSALILFAPLSGFCAREVNILIAENKPSVNVEVSGPFKITNKATGKKYIVKKGGKFAVSGNKKEVKAGSVKSTSALLLELSSPKDAFTLNGGKYNGKLLIKTASSGVNIIERTDLENYLLGVLPYEMSASWPLEALKAQAVAARTYTLKSIEDKKTGDFDLYSDVRSQMYKGVAKVYDNVQKAVHQTKGQVLKNQGNLFYTYYHANCGGHTDPMPWIKSPIKPLSGAKCGYCSASKSAHWQAAIPLENINKFLKQNKIPGTFKSVSVGKKESSGRAKTLRIKTSKSKTEVNCNSFRVAVGSTKMKSCFLTKISGRTFTGKGYGHGGGMCQDGAKGMAEAGKNYKEILGRYYPSSKIEEI